MVWGGEGIESEKGGGGGLGVEGIGGGGDGGDVGGGSWRVGRGKREGGRGAFDDVYQWSCKGGRMYVVLIAATRLKGPPRAWISPQSSHTLSDTILTL